MSSGATVIFYNYDEHWPGVLAVVDELVVSGRYALRDRGGSMAVLERVAASPPRGWLSAALP